MAAAEEKISEATMAREAYVALASRAASGDASVTSEMLAAAAVAATKAESAAMIEVQRGTWDGWIPPYAPHVRGRWTRRIINDDGFPEPQNVEMICTECNATWKTICTSGLVHGHIQRFALVHLHKDVFGVVPRVLPEDQ